MEVGKDWRGDNTDVYTGPVVQDSDTCLSEVVEDNRTACNRGVVVDVVGEGDSTWTGKVDSAAASLAVVAHNVIVGQTVLTAAASLAVVVHNVIVVLNAAIEAETRSQVNAPPQ